MDQELIDIVEDAANELKTAVISKITSNLPPPDAESTLRGKAPKTLTLIDTGNLLGSVETRITVNTDDKVTAEAGIFDEEIAVYALANEYGTNTIPERSFLRSAYDENSDRLLSEMEQKVLDYLIDKFED